MQVYVVVVVVVTQFLPKDGGMVEDHRASEARKLSKVWTRSDRETKGCQRASGAKSPYHGNVNKMRGVLCQMTIDAGQRYLNYANSGEIRV